MMMKDVCLTFCFRRIELRNFNQIRKQGSGGCPWDMLRRPACRAHAGIYSISAWASSLLILNLRALRRPNTRDKHEQGSRALFFICVVIIRKLIRL